MDAHIRKVYVPMTETGFYILLCLREESHGYNIIRKVEELTGGEIRISPGTMYGSLSKMEKDGLICFIRDEEKRKIYLITDLGRQVLELEMKRIERLYRDMMEVRRYEREKIGSAFLYDRGLGEGGGVPSEAPQGRVEICQAEFSGLSL